MMKSIQLVAVFFACALVLGACKSTEVASGDAMSDAKEAVEANMATQLLDKHIEARGGEAALSALSSMSWEGTVEMMGMNMPLKIKYKSPNKMYTWVSVAAMNAEVISAYDGETAWMLNPMNGADAQEMPEEQAKEMGDRAAIKGAVMKYMESGYAYTYEGEEAVKDKPAHKIVFQLPEDKTSTIYLDAETFLEVKSVGEGTDPMSGAQVEAALYMSDFREVDGMMMPFLMEVMFDGNLFQTMKLENIELNTEIKDSIFMMPTVTGSMN